MNISTDYSHSDFSEHLRVPTLKILKHSRAIVNLGPDILVLTSCTAYILKIYLKDST